MHNAAKATRPTIELGGTVYTPRLSMYGCVAAQRKSGAKDIWELLDRAQAGDFDAMQTLVWAALLDDETFAAEGPDAMGKLIDFADIPAVMDALMQVINAALPEPAEDSSKNAATPALGAGVQSSESDTAV